MQAAWSVACGDSDPSTSTSSGRSMRQRSMAMWQRGWNEHPLGVCAGLGGVPGIVSSSLPRAAALGTDRSSASVYGCAG